MDYPTANDATLPAYLASTTTLELLSQQIALVMQQARLLDVERRRATRLEVINQIGRLVTSSLSQQQIFQTVVEAIHTQLGIAYIAAGLVDVHDPQMLVLYAHAGLHVHAVPAGYRQHVDHGIVGAAARTRHLVLVNNVQQESQYLPLLDAPTLHAELAVPIIHNDQLLGVLNFESEQSIDQQQAADLASIADQLGIAIVNAGRYEHSFQRTERLHLIARVSQRIAARLDAQELFATTMHELREQLGYDHVSLFVVDEAEPDILVQHAHASRWPRPDEIGYRQPITRGLLGAAASQRRPQLVHDAMRDPRYVPIPGAPADMDELAMPLLLGDRLMGVLDVASTNGLDDEDVSTIGIIADQLAIALDNAQLFEQTQHVAVLEERQRLARELHDSVTQQLFSMTLLAQALAPAWRRDPHEGEQRIARLLDISQAALAEMRALLVELRPPSAPPATIMGSQLAGHDYVRQVGLVAALQTHINDLASDELDVTLHTQAYTAQPATHEAALFRIAQEALANVRKHAQVGYAALDVGVTDKHVLLRIKDHGHGFRLPPHPAPGSTSATQTRTGIGLQSMRERAELLGGTLHITTAPEHGTTITALVPRQDVS